MTDGAEASVGGATRPGTIGEGAPSTLLDDLDAVARLPVDDWWAALAARPALVDPDVVPHARARSRLLGFVIARACEVDGGGAWPKVRSEVPDATTVLDLPAGPTDQGADVLAAMTVRWAGPSFAWQELLSDVLLQLSEHDIDDGARAPLFSLRCAQLATRAAVDIELIRWALAAAQAEWDDVWAELDDVVGDAERSRAARCVADAAVDVRLAAPIGRWASDLAWMVEASGRHGVEAVRSWHRSLLVVRTLTAGDADDDEVDLLASVGETLGVISHRAGETFLLDAATTAARKVVALTPSGSPHRVRRLAHLGTMLGDAVDAGVEPIGALEDAIAALRDALAGTAPDNPDRAMHLTNLGNRLDAAVHAGLLPANAFAEVVGLHREAVDLAPDDPDRARYLSNLGSSLASAVQVGIAPPTVLTESITATREALALVPDDHPERPRWASNLGTQLAEAVVSGVAPPSLLAEAVAAHRTALDLTPRSHPHHAATLVHLGNRLAQAVRAGIEPPDALRDAIAAHRSALDLTPPDHPRRAARLTNLATALADAVQAGVSPPTDLVGAVAHQRAALDRTPQGHPSRLRRLANLGNLLGMAVQAGVSPREDLAGAVAAVRTARDRTPEGHPDRPMHLSNLASRMAEAIQADVLPRQDLIEAIAVMREVLELTPADHIHRVKRLSNLSSVLTQAVDAGLASPDALLEAIAVQRQAIQLTRDDHPDRAMLLANLGSHIGGAVAAEVVPPELAEEARAAHRRALDLTPFGHPYRAMRESNLAGLLLDLVEGDQVPAHGLLTEVDQLLDDAWMALRMLAVTAGRRRASVRDLRLLGWAAPRIALAAGEPARAVEAIEALRGHLFAPPLPAHVLARLPGDMGQRYAAATTSLAEADTRDRDGIGSIAASAAAQQVLADLVEEIRTSTGDQPFAGRPQLAVLAAGLEDHRAIVHLLSDDDHGTALITLADGTVEAVDLPGLHLSRLAALLPNLGGTANSRHESLLRLSDDLSEQLGLGLLVPLRDALPSRITELAIVATGAWVLVPLPAATAPDGTTLDEMWVTRSLPTARRRPPEMAVPAGRTLVVVGDDGTLPFLPVEKALIAAAVPEATLLPHPLARGRHVSPAEVIQVLDDIHDPVTGLVVSGHGTHDPERGAGVSLPGGVLWGDDLVLRVTHRSRGLAFLNACSTATTALDVPEEAVGIANALLHIGFAAVIATTHPIDDLVATLAMARLQTLLAEDPDASGPHAASALRTHIRTLTAIEVLDWLRTADQLPLAPAARITLQAHRRSFSALPPGHTPFADTPHWAVLTCIGG